MMKKLVLLCLLIGFTVNGFSVFEPSLPDIQQNDEGIANYFFLRPGFIYVYNTIAPNAEGKHKFLENECVSVKNVRDLKFVKYKERLAFSNSDGFAVFSVGKQEVKLMNAQNLYLSAEVSDPKPILKLPAGSQAQNWTYQNTRFTAQSVSKTETSQGTYHDVICVTEYFSPFETFKRYYASGIGLIKEEVYDENQAIKQKFSFELHAVVNRNGIDFNVAGQ